MHTYHNNRSRFKGNKKYSLPPLESQSLPLQNQRRNTQPFRKPPTEPAQFVPPPLAPRGTSNRLVLKPHFACVTDSTPRNGSFPSQYWVVDDEGVRCPKVARESNERISWRAVLEDASKIDGYRKIHAENLKREAACAGDNKVKKYFDLRSACTSKLQFTRD